MLCVLFENPFRKSTSTSQIGNWTLAYLLTPSHSPAQFRKPFKQKMSLGHAGGLYFVRTSHTPEPQLMYGASITTTNFNNTDIWVEENMCIGWHPWTWRRAVFVRGQRRPTDPPDPTDPPVLEVQRILPHATATPPQPVTSWTLAKCPAMNEAHPCASRLS